MHQNEGFQVWFFKNFLRRGSPSPLPRPLPPLFLGLRPRFGLRPQFSGASRPRLGLRPRYSGASRPRFGLRPQLSIGDLGLAPPKINSWIRPCLADPVTLSAPTIHCLHNIVKHSTDTWRVEKDNRACDSLVSSDFWRVINCFTYLLTYI